MKKKSKLIKFRPRKKVNHYGVKIVKGNRVILTDGYYKLVLPIEEFKELTGEP